MELNDVQVLQKTYQPIFPPRVNSWEVTKTLLTLAETAALTDAVCSDCALTSAGRSLGSALRPGVWAGHGGPVGGVWPVACVRIAVSAASARLPQAAAPHPLRCGGKGTHGSSASLVGV